MISNNPFSILSETVPAAAMQAFVIVMGLLGVIGTLVDIIHKKNVKYFFENAKKAKLSATKTLSTAERISVISKTIVKMTKSNQKKMWLRVLGQINLL